MAALGGRAVDLAELASTSSGSPLVRAVADDIRRAQLRRVSDSVAWLRGWTPSPSTSGDGPSRSTTGHGAVGPDDLRRLRRSAGLAFDRLWLRLMARQQRAEARAARVEVGGGRNAAARALARTVITGNRAQLTRLRGLLVDEGD
jgi:uncharacterized protein (DUF305 family)